MNRRLTRLGLAATLALLPVANGAAFAQMGPDVTFELRPHCEEQDHAAADPQFGGEVPHIDGVMDLAQTSRVPCPEYEVRDPRSRHTNILKLGDTLDMDLIMHNPSGRPITRFRAWIGYDSNVLEGMTITLSDAFPVATPGEADFSIADNYVKLSGTSQQPVTGTKIVLARITLTVKSTPAIGDILSFYGASGLATAHTGAFTTDGTTEENVAATVQGDLVVRLLSAAESSAPTVPPTSSSPDASSMPAVPLAASSASDMPTSSEPSLPITSSASSSSAAPVLPTVFAKLQVQGLRVTTEGSSVFLAWNPLPSANLAGYNLYYGTISGRYLQRRSVDKEGQTLTIRALPVGQTYYFAVRAVDAGGGESDFSQEVAVSVGNPATSTSPLSGALIAGGPNGNAPYTDGTISGDSGPASWFLLFATASAVIGTFLAFRRQWAAVSTIQR